MPLMKASDLSEIPAAIMNVLLEIPDWRGIRERLAQPKTTTSERANRPHPDRRGGNQ
jgi:hypothetical protein